MEITKEIQEKAEALQEEMQSVSREILKNAKIGSPLMEYQDAANVYILLKLSELEQKMEALNEKVNDIWRKTL